MRDWGVSRQRYWGCPIPIVNCPSCGEVTVPKEQLPVKLPEDVAFDGVGSPIKKMPEFYETICPKCGGKAERETDTFDTFMESSWYYARYACRDNEDAMLDERVNYWLPVDQYVGGIEHAILHLLYARFYHKLLRDEGFVSSDEPFKHLLTQGMVLKDGSKMSKSKGNTVDPQELIQKYGADTVRLFTMFASPPEQSLEWNDSAVEGAHRFLKRVWGISNKPEYQYPVFDTADKRNSFVEGFDWTLLTSEQKKIRIDVHVVVEQVTRDFDKYQFNTVVAGCMKLMNSVGSIPMFDEGDRSQRGYAAVLFEAVDILLRILSPIVPHITHELWPMLRVNAEGDVLLVSQPKHDPDALLSDSIEIVVQVNGKVRGKVEVLAGADKPAVEEAAIADANVQRFIEGKEIKKVIVVPGKLVNIVAK